MIYLSGPITGRPFWEVKNHFNQVGMMVRRQAARYTDELVEVYDPSRLNDDGFTWDTYMKIAREVLQDPKITAICMMKGWEKSKGCMMEIKWAHDLGLPIIYEPGAERA